MTPKQKLFKAYRECLDFNVKRKLLKFINDGFIKLGVSDTDWGVSNILDEYFEPIFHRKSYLTSYYLNKEKTNEQ